MGDADRKPGLTSAEARERLLARGPNALPEQRRVPLWRRFVRQFHSPLIYLLLFALTFDVVLWLAAQNEGGPAEAATIALILIFNAGLGLYQERRSEAALARLKTLAGDRAWVLRDDRFVRVPVEEVVHGDRVRLEAGDRVPADGLLSATRGAMADESVLTGESVPVDKPEGSEAFSGTLLVRGRALLDVTRTGPASAMGRLATMLESITAAPTPLERRIDRLGRQIARYVLLLAAALGLLGILGEGIARAPQMIIFAVALAVAAVPEGLPAVLTVALALGVERMARRRAVVRRLAAVEALGSVTVIATDKTGTLTENRMEVRSIDAIDTDGAHAAAVLANDADLATGAGDPLDLGLLRFAASQGMDIAAMRAGRPRLSERPFDSAWRFARVTVDDKGRGVGFLKGAPEVVLDRCQLTDGDRRTWHDKADGYAREGFRVVALARGEGEAEANLALLGLVLFWDPPRPEVAAAVKTALEAGVRIVMITGDHPATSLAIARQIGIATSRVVGGDELEGQADAGQSFTQAPAASPFDGVNVFARVRADQKLALVEALQREQQVVAMTGDGVNDAPALKRSDIGIAMGQRGSDVSREVADLVLLDDNFATIVGAIEEGRGIYDNVQKFLRFLFSTNLSEVLLVSIGAVVAFVLDLRDAAGALVLPLTAAQILWINLITDGLPALALAFDRTPGVMQQPPRPADAALLDRASIRFIVVVGVAKTALALGILAIASMLGDTANVGRTMVFHFMAIGQLLLTYPSRHGASEPLSNPYLHAAVATGIAVQVAAGTLGVSQDLLALAALPLERWLPVGVFAFAAWLAAEVVARIVWRDARQASARQA